MLFRSREEYKRMLDELQHRAVFGERIEDLVIKGYYGEIIREAWIKDGKI